MRSCTEGATPDMGCLSEGELALNITDGKIFTRGCTTGQFFTWSSDGSTADDIVTSVQGMTGDVTFADLVGVCSVNGFTGAVDFTTKTFHAAGFSTQGGITADGLSFKLGLAFESFPSGVTIAATNQRQVITLGGGGPHDARMSLHTGSAHREIVQADPTAGMTIGVPVGISGGLCGDHANFVGLTVDHISVAGGNVARTNVTNTFAEQQEFAKGISIDAGGITFADGTQQTTAFRAGLKYTITHDGLIEAPSAGGIKMTSNYNGTVVDVLAIHDTDANGNDISSIMSLFATNGGFLQVLKEDGTELLIAAVDQDESSIASFGSDVLNIAAVTNGFEVDTIPSIGDVVYVYIVPNLVTAVQTVGGHAGHIQVNGWQGLTMTNAAGDGVGYLGVLKSAIDFEIFRGPTSGVTGGRVQGITFADDSTQTTAAGTTHTDQNFSTTLKDKLDGIEASADVTDATNVTSAGALMDSELTSIADVKALNQSVVSGASPTFNTTNFTDASNKRLMTDAQESKLDGITSDVNVATFSIDASSGIATGAKTKALHRVPFDATLTKFELKSSAVGFTGAVYVAGSDFGLPTTGAVTGCSLGVSGLTGSSTVFNSATITAGNLLYFDVFNNTNGATNAQAFLTYTRR